MNIKLVDLAPAGVYGAVKILADFMTTMSDPAVLLLEIPPVRQLHGEIEKPTPILGLSDNQFLQLRDAVRQVQHPTWQKVLAFTQPLDCDTVKEIPSNVVAVLTTELLPGVAEEMRYRLQHTNFYIVSFDKE